MVMVPSASRSASFTRVAPTSAPAAARSPGSDRRRVVMRAVLSAEKRSWVRAPHPRRRPMYTRHYGLREKPFSLTPDPRYLYLSSSHREALAHLLYGIEQGEGFIAVTGEVGTGKTTLCRTLRQRRQRIGVRWRLDSLTEPEASDYIRHRLRVAAGSDTDLFTPAALRELRRRSRGVPRLVNLLADRALLAGYADGSIRVERAHVGRAARPSLRARQRRRARVLPRWNRLAGKRSD